MSKRSRPPAASPTPAPPSSSSPLPNSAARPTFAQIIEQDHNSINVLAARLRSARTPVSTKLSLRDEIIWRLIRHDVSEDMVMRPAFLAHLPPGEGQAMVDRDRLDHDNARAQVLKLFELDMASEPFSRIVNALFDELQEHMRVESGEQIPRLESMLGPETSESLARDYERTLILRPDLLLAGQRVWPGGVQEYASCSLDRFKQIFDLVQTERAKEEDRSSFEEDRGTARKRDSVKL